MSPTGIAAAALAAVGAGLVNALAGGGTLLTFPSLLAVGVPPVAANVTNTVALLPGYVGGIFAQRRALRGQGARLWILVPAGLAGGVAGALLLFATGERLFRALVPVLILTATALLALQEPVKRWLARREAGNSPGGGSAQGVHAGGATPAALPLVAAASVYGGYFGAGVGVVLIAVLGLTLHDRLDRLNALKQTLSLSANLSAAVLFCFSGQVVWPVVAPMAAGALAGGWMGGRLAGRIPPAALRWAIVAIGLVVGIAALPR